MRHAPLALLALLLAGCALPDQRTFLPAPAAPGAAEVSRVRLPDAPLARVALPAQGDWLAPLAAAVQAALARSPGAQVELLAPVPPDAGADAVARAGADARQVADALGRAGIPPDRLHLGLQADPGSPGREVRLYVR